MTSESTRFLGQPRLTKWMLRAIVRLSSLSAGALARELHPADEAIEEVERVVRPGRRLGGVLDREAVVLGRDLDAAGGEVLDGLVGPAVPELELVGLGAEGEGEELVAEADAE